MANHQVTDFLQRVIIMIKKILLSIFLIFISSFLIIGCSQETMLQENNMPSSGIIKVFPLTSSDEPISGHVEVMYSGPKKNINMNYEIWEEGKVKKSESSLSSSIGDNYKGEVSVSLKNKSTDNMKKVYQILMHAGNGTFSDEEELNIPDGLHKSLSISRDIEISDDEEIAVWGYAVYKDGSTPTKPSEESIEKSAKMASWALVLRIHMSN